MKIILKTLGDHKLNIPCHKMNGFHRPLSEEIANLALICSYTVFFSEWLAYPPLGESCSVEIDDKEILQGVIYEVNLTKEYVQIKIEA